MICLIICLNADFISPFENIFCHKYKNTPTKICKNTNNNQPNNKRQIGFHGNKNY